MPSLQLRRCIACKRIGWVTHVVRRLLRGTDWVAATPYLVVQESLACKYKALPLMIRILDSWQNKRERSKSSWSILSSIGFVLQNSCSLCFENYILGITWSPVFIFNNYFIISNSRDNGLLFLKNNLIDVLMFSN